MFEAAIPGSAQRAFEEFVDLKVARLWLPGLKRARVVRSDATGRPLEVFYEFGDTLSYALVYAYDDAATKVTVDGREPRWVVRWVPSSGVRDAVSGMASFEDTPQGCRFTYALESLKRDAGHEQEVASAFVAWMNKAR